MLKDRISLAMNIEMRLDSYFRTDRNDKKARRAVYEWMVIVSLRIDCIHKALSESGTGILNPETEGFILERKLAFFKLGSLRFLWGVLPVEKLEMSHRM